MAEHDDTEEEGIGDLLLLPVYAVLAAFGVYTTFAVCGALLDTIIDGGVKFAVAVLLAFVFPALTAMGFNNVRKEGATGIGIVNRILLGTAILSAGTCVIVAVTMAQRVVPTMRSDPNWFLDDPHRQDGFPQFNRKYHRVAADGFCQLAHAAGTYWCPGEE